MFSLKKEIAIVHKKECSIAIGDEQAVTTHE
jgi:hypothetical protein